MEVLLGILLFALLFVPLLLIGWACVRVFRNRNVWIADSAALPWSALDSAAYVGAKLTPLMQKRNYRVVSQGQGTLVFAKEYRPIWLLIPIIVFFPLGLLSLLYKKTVEITMNVSPYQPGTGSSVAFSGKGPPYLEREIAEALSELTSPPS